MRPKTGETNLGQLAGLFKKFGFDVPDSSKDIFMEFITLLPQNKDHAKIPFPVTGKKEFTCIFDHGCDAIVKRFEEEFDHAFAEK